MTDDKKNIPGAGSETIVTSGTSEQQNFDVLTPLEEKVLRMLHGVSEDDAHALKFGLGAQGDDRTRLAMMERHLLDAFQWGEMGSFEVSEEHLEAKARIISKLRED